LEQIGAPPAVLAVTKAAIIASPGNVAGKAKLAEKVAKTGASALSKGGNRFTNLISGASKTDARAALRSGEISDLSPEQHAAILKRLRAGRADNVSVKASAETGNARAILERAGAESGFQRLSSEILPDGSVKRLAQAAFDDAGNLVRQPGGVLFDVKR